MENAINSFMEYQDRAEEVHEVGRRAFGEGS